LAALLGHLAVVEWLVKHGGADVAAVGRDGFTALHSAAQLGHLAVVEWLVKHGGADVAAMAGHVPTALHLAALHGHLAVVEWLVKHGGADVAAVELHGSTALHIVALQGHLAVVEWLVKHGGADVSCLDANGFTALDMMCHLQRSHVLEGVQLLAQHLALRSPPLAARVCERLPAQCRDAAVSAVASSYKDVTERFAAYVQEDEDRAREVQCLCVQAAAALRR
jgi:ankyrin repeat protein